MILILTIVLTFMVSLTIHIVAKISKEVECKDHKYIKMSTNIRKLNDEFSSFVCIDYSCKIPICVKCGNRLDPEDLKIIKKHPEIGLEKKDWDDMKKKGYIVISH